MVRMMGDPQLERAIAVLRKANMEVAALRKARSTRFIKEPKDNSRVYKSNKICQAINMTGKPCAFKASSLCGKFCKRHIIVE